MGAEVHIDIYDDRIELVSPGAMLDGSQIQDCDIDKVPSLRRNPVIADVFTQLDYMEKRGSGLRKMRELTEKLPNYLPAKEPQYQTQRSAFYTTFYNLNWEGTGQIPVEEIAARITSSEEKFGEKQKSSVKSKIVRKKSSEETQKSSEEKFGRKNQRVNRTAQKILDLIISDPSTTAEDMSYKIGVSSRAVEKHLKNLRDRGILVHEGSTKSGYWRVIVNNE